MPDKPTTAAGYPPGQADLVRSTCLYVATKLGDLMDDLVVVGGLVPCFLVDQENLPPGAGPHAGTMDLDLGLALALLHERRYQEIAERLRRAGFSPDVNERDNPTSQRWRIEAAGRVTVDFLIPPSLPADRAGALRNLEPGFAAMITPGLRLAFRDRQSVTLDGTTIMGENARRSVWVCAPGAYVVLKALAFASRGENKDAYDLFYVVRNYGAGVADVAARLRPLLGEQEAKDAVVVLRRDFLDADGIGPRRVAEFQTGGPAPEIHADVAGFIDRLLRAPAVVTHALDRGPTY